MPQVRRNDPCPCGSGKKYKNCCLRSDRYSRSRQLSVQGDVGAAMSVLYNVAQSPRFARDLSAAVGVYWGSEFAWQDAPESDADDMSRMFEWFAHDYSVGDDGRYIVDIVRDERGATLPPELREVLDAWGASTMCLYRVVKVNDIASLTCYDSLRERTETIADASLARLAQVGEVLVGRRYELQGVVRLSPGTMLLPEAYEEPIVDYVTNAYGVFQDEHPGATWDQFLRQNGHLFMAFLLSARGESLRGLIGPGTRYHDPAIWRDRMREHTAEVRQEMRREAMERSAEQRPGRPSSAPRREAPPERRTSSGIILPGSEPREPTKPQTGGEGQSADAPRPTILIPGRDS